VVDDESAITRVIRRTLSAGHDVTALGGGQEALARLTLDRDWDVILCDLMMPEMNGMELFHAVRTLAPSLADRFVFLSGGVFEPRVQAFLDAIPNARLEKPFDVAQLRSLVAARVHG
jgi:CheY-like chemotaxis protein